MDLMRAVTDDLRALPIVPCDAYGWEERLEPARPGLRRSPPESLETSLPGLLAET
jgi:hypothetical protein